MRGRGRSSPRQNPVFLFCDAQKGPNYVRSSRFQQSTTLCLISAAPLRLIFLRLICRILFETFERSALSPYPRISVGFVSSAIDSLRTSALLSQFGLTGNDIVCCIPIVSSRFSPDNVYLYRLIYTGNRFIMFLK